MKNVRFTAYKSTRPVLLQEVTSIVENGLRELAAKYTENIPNEFIVDVYSAAFDRYIEESTLYKPFLSSVKQCYDSTIAECTRRTLQYDELDIMLKKRDDVHFSKMQAAEEEFTAKLRVSEAKINVLQATAKESTTNTAKLVLENSKLHESNLMLKKELEASKNTSGLLSAQLARLAEDKLKSDSVESARLLELSQLKQQEMTLNNELERLVPAQAFPVHALLYVLFPCVILNLFLFSVILIFILILFVPQVA